VPVPETYGVITFQNEVKNLSNIVGERKSFVNIAVIRAIDLLHES